jgi:hypothetical protein
MKKYIVIESEIFEATLIVETAKTNDEIVPIKRKNGRGADKNHFFVGNEFIEEFKDFFPYIVEDKINNTSNKNNVRIKNYFSITNIINDIDFINNEIENYYKNENKINKNELINIISELSKEQNLNTNFFIESELGAAGNGIGFKNWNNPFSSVIKILLLHTTKTNIYLFKKGDEICSYFEFIQLNQEINTTKKNEKKTNSAIQKIYFGAPGTGKSHKVKEILMGNESRTERITFHPDYDYNSFIGGYKPMMNGDNIRYEFVPQIFINVYVKAWKDPLNQYYLVIEEINRGNCAEIFGDIFQILDRSNEYHISPSTDLAFYLKKELNGNENNNGEKLILPTNFNIIATMNTADQSLYPMDSAFKRRWDWEYVPINYEEYYLDQFGDKVENESFYYEINLSDVEYFSWIEFIKTVNNIIKTNENLGPDKCIGNYFIKVSNKKIELDVFINKVIFYLSNDVFKDENEGVNIFKNKSSYEDFFPIKNNGYKKMIELLEYLKIEIHKKTV